MYSEKHDKAAASCNWRKPAVGVSASRHRHSFGNLGALSGPILDIWHFGFTTSCNADSVCMQTAELLAVCELTWYLFLLVDTQTNFVNAIASQYKDLPFHNFKHGFSVLHICYMMLRECPRAHQNLSYHKRFALLVAALCHDVGHPGTLTASRAYVLLRPPFRFFLHRMLSTCRNWFVTLVHV